MISVTKEEYVSQLCCGNKLAMQWLQLWATYAHEVDDIIDGDRPDPQDILATFALAIELYSHPFYLQHLEALRQVMLNTTNLYADTVAWEKSPTPWQAQVADAMRCCGNEVTLAVALICGGYRHARRVSLQHRELCWRNQHEPEGLAAKERREHKEPAENQ